MPPVMSSKNELIMMNLRFYRRTKTMRRMGNKDGMINQTSLFPVASIKVLGVINFLLYNRCGREEQNKIKLHRNTHQLFS